MQTTDIAPEFARLPEACRRFGLSRSRLYLLAGEGLVRFVKDGNTTLVDLGTVRAYLASRPAASIRPPTAAVRADGTVEGYDDAKQFDLFTMRVADLDAVYRVLHRLLHRSDYAVVRGAVADRHQRGLRRRNSQTDGLQGGARLGSERMSACVTTADLAARLKLHCSRDEWRGTCPVCGYPEAFALRTSKGGRLLGWCASCQNRAAIAQLLAEMQGGAAALERVEHHNAAPEVAPAFERAMSLWAGSEPAPGPPAEHYLTVRGLPHLAASSALRFRPDCSHPSGGRRRSPLRQSRHRDVGGSGIGRELSGGLPPWRRIALPRPRHGGNARYPHCDPRARAPSCKADPPRLSHPPSPAAQSRAAPTLRGRPLSAPPTPAGAAGSDAAR